MIKFSQYLVMLQYCNGQISISKGKKKVIVEEVVHQNGIVHIDADSILSHWKGALNLCTMARMTLIMPY